MNITVSNIHSTQIKDLAFSGLGSNFLGHLESLHTAVRCQEP